MAFSREKYFKSYRLNKLATGECLECRLKAITGQRLCKKHQLSHNKASLKWAKKNQDKRRQAQKLRGLKRDGILKVVRIAGKSDVKWSK